MLSKNYINLFKNYNVIKAPPSDVGFEIGTLHIIPSSPN
jgi:hypothetical protein